MDYLNLGMILKSQKKSNEANECFDKAILTNPNYSKAYNNKGKSNY